MRFVSDWQFYCERLGRNVPLRSWNRLICGIALADCGVIERRSRLSMAALIRKDRPFATLSVEILQNFALIHEMESKAIGGESLSGQQLIEMIQTIRPVTDRTIRNWGRPYGLSLAPTRKYSGDELRRWLKVIAMNLPTVREVQKKYMKKIEELTDDVA